MKRSSAILFPAFFCLVTGADAALAPLPAHIERDAFGVPTISSPTDAGVAFGLGYAQAEDDLSHIEESILRAIGRGSERDGDASFSQDFLVAALEVPQLAQEEYASAAPHMRQIYDAFAAGLNTYVDLNGAQLQSLTRFEPWHPLALLRFKYHVLEFVGYAGVDVDNLAISLGDPDTEPANGSNAWALAPDRTQTGAAFLFINPHVAFFGPARYYEARVRSGEGWRFSGVGRYGFPLLYMGHSPSLGWAHTDNYPDIGDLYVEQFDHPTKPLAYRYGPGWRLARETFHDIRVRGAAGLETRRVRIVRTHHGPIITTFEGRPVSIRLSRLTEGGWFDQWLAMSKANNFAQFRRALLQGAIPYMNIVYADNSGNIFFAYNGAVPRRDDRFDFRSPVDGADPRTEWRGYHSFQELPQILNPGGGFLLSTNSDPLAATVPAAHDHSHFPRYMIGGETLNPRARTSLAILTETPRFSFEDWMRAATDTRVGEAERLLPELIRHYERISAQVAPDDLAPLIEVLSAWDRRSRIDSVAMTIFANWHHRMRAHGMPEDAATQLRLLRETRDALADLHGRWGIAWGEINRHQRPATNDANGFTDDAVSLPVPGAPGALGIIFNYYSGPATPRGRSYGIMGNSYVSVVAFGAGGARSRSVMYFGQSGNPSSAHYFDQAPIYVHGGFRPEEWLVHD